MRQIPLYWCVLAALCLSATGTAGPACAASTARTAQKAKAEADRAELQQKLKSLKSEISKTETAKDHASDVLAESEQAISEVNRSLRDLQTEQGQTETRLQQLAAQQEVLKAQVETQKNQLAGFLKRQYIKGDSDRIKLLLSGDNPNRINRDLQYMGYVSQTQAKMIASLRDSLAAVDKNKQEAQDAKDELDDIAQEQKDNKAQLEQEKKKRAGILAQLSDKLYAQKKQADSLQRDEQRLGSLVSKLNILIEEQIKADRLKAEQAEKQRQERLAAQKEKARIAALESKKSGKPPAKPSPSDAIDADEPPRQAKMEVPPAGEFDRLRGQMKLPLKGDILARFGSKRGDGPSWKGMFIRAAEGAEVHAIAPGKVIFADWYKGYGNMIIVGHGDQYMSIYGNNQAVLKHVGDNVKAGDVIAAAGNSGGNQESGLYFEIRHQGRPFDPQNWITVK